MERPRMYVYLMDTENSMVMPEKGGVGVGRMEAKGGKDGDICNSVNNKNKKNIILYCICDSG